MLSSDYAVKRLDGLFKLFYWFSKHSNALEKWNTPINKISSVEY